MKTQITNCKDTATASTLNKVMLIFMAIIASASTTADDSFQGKMLFAPSESMLEAEERGRIMIYDGLEAKVVDKALDKQFDRIENMMFVRITNVQENGEIAYEDDGCD